MNTPYKQWQPRALVYICAPPRSTLCLPKNPYFEKKNADQFFKSLLKNLIS